MAAQYLVAAPIEKVFTEPKRFRSIFNGSIYIGLADQDPMNPSNQQQIYVIDESGAKVPVAQPIKIGPGGYAEYGDTGPAKFVCDLPYSMVVLDKLDKEQWRVPDIRAIDLMNVTIHDVPGSIDLIFNCTVSQISSGLFQIGQKLSVSDRANAKFSVVAKGAQTSNGYNIIDAGDGRVATLDYEGGAIFIDHLGADNSGSSGSADAFSVADSLASAVGNGGASIMLTPGATYVIEKHITLETPIVCDGNRATVQFTYDGTGLDYVYPAPRNCSNVVFHCTQNSKTINLMTGEGYFLEWDNVTAIGFANVLTNSGVYVTLKKCRLEGNINGWLPRTLESQTAPSTMFSAYDTIFVANSGVGLGALPGTAGSNDDLINLQLDSCGFEQNGTGLKATQRIWNLTLVDCWFEQNATLAYDLHGTSPTFINCRIHPSDQSKTYIGDWAGGTGARTGNVNFIDESGVNCRNVRLHDVSQDSYPSTKKAWLRQIGDDTQVSITGDENDMRGLIKSAKSSKTRQLVEMYVQSTSTTAGDVVGIPDGWTLTKQGSGTYEFTIPYTLDVRPQINVTPFNTNNLADDGRTFAVGLGNTDLATWNSFKTVNRFRVYTKNNGSLTDLNFTVSMFI